VTTPIAVFVYWVSISRHQFISQWLGNRQNFTAKRFAAPVIQSPSAERTAVV